MTLPDPDRSAAVSGAPAVAVRSAGAQDWPAVWPILAEVIAEQETFPSDPAMSEADARSMWLVPAPGRTTVAVRDGRVVGTGNMYANRPGPGSDIASGSFMVATPARGRGAGRALVETFVRLPDPRPGRSARDVPAASLSRRGGRAGAR